MTDTDRVVEYIKTQGYHRLDDMENIPILSHAECDDVAERTGIIHTVIKGYFIKRSR
jgi:hypothetical protein